MVVMVMVVVMVVMMNGVFISGFGFFLVFISGFGFDVVASFGLVLGGGEWWCWCGVWE